MQIIPMRDLKDTVKIEELCAKENGPVFVTKNGYGRLVVMDMEYFDRVFGQLYEATLINSGWEDFKNGRMNNPDEVLKKLEEKYGLNDTNL